MKCKKLEFEIAEISFCYIYEKEINIYPDMLINRFLRKSTQYDVVNYIYNVSELDFEEYEKRKPIVQTKIWSLFEDSVVFFADGEFLAKIEFINEGVFKTSVSDLEVSVHPLPLCITGFLLQRMLEFRGIILHGAALNFCRKTVLLTGNSGVGKSTISRLLKRKNTTTQICDDRCIVIKKEDKLFVYGNPLDCKIERSINQGYEIDAIFFLHHSQYNRCYAVPDEQIMNNLLKISMLPYFDPQGIIWSMKLLEEMEIKIKCFDLYFKPDNYIIDFLEEQIKGISL